ncbi:MAG: leucine-rich repeat domain-containing protein [Clostridiales bacterium]|nr:leucine-rich repeat domain-containing protein [Clostridiales bacterium]
MHFDETYYTKDDDGNWNTGECYVCTICGHAVDSDYTSDSSDYEEGTDSYEDAAAIAGHTYVAASDEPTVTWADDHSSVTVEGDVICSVCGSMTNKYGYSLDCLCADDTVEETESVTTSSIDVTYSGNCVEGVTATYTATVTLESYGELTVTDVVEDEDGQNSYVVEEDDWEWTWDEENDTYTVIAKTMTCPIDNDVQENVTAVVTSEITKEATCTEDGTIVYTAVATVYDTDGTTVLGSAQTMKTESIAAFGHDYDSSGVCTRCGDTLNSGSKGTSDGMSGSVEVGSTVSDSTGTYSVTSTGSNKTVTYTKPTSSSATSVVIPSTITVDGVTYQVTAVSASAFKGNTKMKTVMIPSTVTSIGKSAFEGCTALTTVSGCASVITIGNRAFYGCKKLTQVGSAKSKVKLTKVETIGKYAFYGCKSITVVNLTSKNLTKIKNFAFQYCLKLKKLVSKSTILAKIGKKAFYGDKKLASVTLKTTKLKNSNVGAKAFTGTKSNCTFKVPAKKMSAYKTLFKKKGAGSKIKMKK